MTSSAPHPIGPVEVLDKMKIPADAIIAPSKLTDYLLLTRPSDDKSRFLAQAGFHRASPKLLEAAIRQLAADAEAVDDGVNDYGTFWRDGRGLARP